MKPQQQFRPSDRAWCTDATNSTLEAGHVYYVFGVIETTPQRLILNAGKPEGVFDADRFDRMRPAHAIHE